MASAFLDSLKLDAHAVLGTRPGATPRELREAYHKKSLKHHPDRGGDEWAFRIVTLAYESLLNEAESAQAADTPAARKAAAASVDHEQVRPGVTDKDVEPVRRVQVEVVWLRYEVEDVMDLIERQVDRDLSGSIGITWPDPDLADEAAQHPQATRIVQALNAAFDELRTRTPAMTARSQVEGTTFRAWLTYDRGKTAAAAFKVFHVGLKARGLGVKQWTRDVTVARTAEAR